MNLVHLAQVPQLTMDVIFALDASESIGSAIFAQTKFFVSQVIDYFDVDNGLVRVGACSYSERVSSCFNLSDHTSVNAVKNATTFLKYSGGNANTAAVLAYIRTVMLTSAAGYRSNVPTLIVILTDGPSRDPFGALVSSRLRS